MIEKAFRLIDTISEWLGMIFTIGMVLVIFMQVVWRYILNTPLSWPEEIGRYLFIWSTYIAIAISMNGDGHLRISILPDMLSKKHNKIVNIICSVINMAFFLFISYLCIEMTMEVMEMEQMAISIELPVWIIWIGIPVFCFIVFLQATRNLYLLLKNRLSIANSLL